MPLLSRFGTVLFLSAALLLVRVAPVRGDVADLVASKDNTMYSESGTLSNGSGSYFFTGRTLGGNTRRALIAFDIAAQIPSGATINSATLQLYVSRTNDEVVPRTTTLHRVQRNWGEGTSQAPSGEGQGGPVSTGDATWTHSQYPDSLWTSPGGDYDVLASASTDVDSLEKFYSWNSAQMAIEVQGWLDDPASNHGWVLIGVESTSPTSKRFDSRTSGTIAGRPVLSVDYTPASGDPTGACCLPDSSCIITTAVDCMNLGGTYQGDGSPCIPSPCDQLTTVSLSATKDNTLYEDLMGTLSNGAGEYLLSGVPGGGGIRRGVVAFDMAGAVPAEATITGAVLRLYNNKGGGFPQTIYLYRVLADWGEGASDASGDEEAGAAATSGDATWIHRFYPDSLWSSAGGDYMSASASATTEVLDDGAYAWASSQMISDVQDWLNDPASNFGWLVRGNEFTVNTIRSFSSRESPVAANRPELEITYYLPPSPPSGACCFDDGTCADTTEAACSSLGGTYQGDATACSTSTCPVFLEAFVDSLPMVPVATPITGSPGGTASYEIAMTEFTQQLHRDLPPTRLWGYDGQFPGPTILAGRDRPVSVTWINDLRDSTGSLRTEHYLPVETCIHGPNMNGAAALTVVHLHGGHVPAAVDGHPDSSFAPGDQVTYVYPNNQQATTLWYHDHALGITRLNVMMGLAGIYLITDSTETAIDLPSGEFDVPLVIQDRSFNPDGSLSYPETFQDHFFGDKILVNGKVWPFANVKQGKYRFRILNACNSRFVTLSLSNGAPLTVIGTDGGLLPAPVVRDSLTIPPAERYEVVIDFEGHPPGTEIVLENSAPIRFPGVPGDGVIPEVLKFIVQSETGHTNPVPATLRPVPAIPESLSAMSRDFILEKEADPCAGARWTINGLSWSDITEQVGLGTTEIWRFINKSGISHPMHIHLVMFQILNRETFTPMGDSIVVTGTILPDSSEMGWKDTAPVGPNETLRVIATYTDYPGTFVYHCHIVEHEDHEMMRQFEVISSPTSVPGDSGPSPLILARNYPNPFGSSTLITFALAKKSKVSLRIYDIVGREVRELVDANLAGREHSVVWDGRDGSGRPVSAGIYFLRLVAGSDQLTRKMTIVR